MRRPIRILELRSVRGTGGGPEKTILLGAAGTNRRRFAVTVCYIRDQRDRVFGIDAWARSIGVPYVEIRERHSFDPLVWPRLRSLVREHQIDIVHAHDYKTNVLAWMLSSTSGVRVLSTVHGWTGHTRRERLVYYPLDKRVLARFPRLIAVSSEIRDELVRSGARHDCVAVVLNGIDHQAFLRTPARVPAIRTALGIGSNEFVIGAIGRLEPQKRFDLLIETVARLQSNGHCLRLLIAGEGTARPLLEQRIRGLGLGSVCRLLGHYTDVTSLHHAFDLFVQASDYEGTPNALLEAMALGTPVVATDVGGTREMVVDGEHGLIVPAGDARALAHAITRALQDPVAMQVRAHAARRRVERELSFERRMRRVEVIYDELVEQGGGVGLSAPAPAIGTLPRSPSGAFEQARSAALSSCEEPPERVG